MRAGKDESLNRRNSGINPLIELFSEYLSKIDAALKREIDLYSWSEFYARLRYACDGGKRIRPLILVLSSESVDVRKANRDGNLSEDVHLAASAIELLHTESVIHDDIIDEQNVRRGKPSFHVKYGYNTSILTADFVLGIILNIGSKINNIRVSGELSNAAIRMSEGEMMEIKMSKESDISVDDYIKVLDHKTAALFEASAKIGAILGEGEEDQIHALASFGNLLGIAYQIHDDLMDWNNEDKLFGVLAKKNQRSMAFVNGMEKMYISYSTEAKNELRKIHDSLPKKHLEHLTDLAAIQF